MATDQEVLTEIQYALIETPDGGLTVSSGLWTTAELINAINTAQLWVIQDGCVRLSRQTLLTTPGLPRYNLPETWLLTQRVSWETADGDFSELPRDSSWSADYLDPDWSFNLSVQPLCYTDVDSPIPALEVMPAASDNGLLHILFAEIPTALSNTGVSWTIPDMCIPMAKWKAIAILLAKDGRGQDLPRAQMALDRAMAGMAALKLFLRGWS